jgi:hypothetical protein
MNRISASLSLALVLFTGCSKIPGLNKPSTAIAGTNDDAASVPSVSSAAAVAPPPKLAATSDKLGKFCATLSYADALKDKEAWDLFRDALSRQEIESAPNPDPAIITEWRSDSPERNAKIALQAATLRTWPAACAKEYAAWRAADAEVAAANRAELDRLKAEPNWYAAVTGFAALRAKVGGELAATRFGSDQGTIGFRYEVAAAVAEYLRSSPHPLFPGAGGMLQVDDGLTKEAGVKAGRPFGDAAFEQDRFCTSAVDDGLRDLPGMWQTGDSLTQKALKWPEFLGDAHRKEVAAKDAQLREAAAAKLGWPDALEAPQVTRASALQFHDDTKTAYFDSFEVLEAGKTLVVGSEEHWVFDYDCKNGKKVIGYDDDGNFKYEQKCKHGENNYTIRVALTADELPPGWKWKVGQRLSFYAAVTDDQPSEKKRKDTGTDGKRPMAATLRHIVVK